MRFRWERSGVTEARIDATVCAVDLSGSLLYADGDVDESLLYRSAIKPLQATASLEGGARLAPEQLAIACGSHGGFPVHVALVRTILENHEIGEDALQTPADWPMAQAARDLLISRGVAAPRPVFHNCSGKHAGFLAACRASGWSTAEYLDPGHPLQRSVIGIVAEASRTDPQPVGIDGCGAPVLRGSTRGLATAFAAISGDLRFAAVADAMSRYPALVADGGPHGRVGRWWGGPVKGGAEGCVGLGRHGLGIAAKAWSGDGRVAVAAALAAASDLGLLSPAMAEALDDVSRPPVTGGARTVGTLVRD